ncbi:MAG: hypothetical protein HYU67_03335 [Flavobacteriia bacterium]|nr:hypothetical protein [Flavobacteriia bacterium]
MNKSAFIVILFSLVCIVSQKYLAQDQSFPMVSICPSGIQQLAIPHWESLGPFQDIPSSTPNVGFISSLAVHPKNQQIVYIGSNTGGVYKTTNFFDSIPVWKSCTDQLKWHGLGINDICVDFSNPKTLFVATGFNSGYGSKFGCGVLMSENEGKTWTNIGPNGLKKDNLSLKLSQDYSNPDFLWLAQNDQLYRFNKIEKNWTLLFTLPSSIGLNPFHPGDKCRNIVDIEQSLENPKVWLISTDYSGNRKELEQSLVFLTKDNGKTWIKININEKYKSDRIRIATSNKYPNSFYISGTYYEENKKNNQNFILSTNDLGQNWNVINELTFSGAGYYKQELELSKQYDHLYVGAYFVHSSKDGGKTFFQNTKNQHIDCRFLKVIHSSDSMDWLLSGNDGGVSFSMNCGKTWSNKNGVGLNIKQFIALGTANSTNELLVGGTQDNDIAIYDGKWHSPQLTNDGSEALVDKNNNEIIYAQPFCCDPSQLKVRKYQKKLNHWKITENISPPESIGNGLRPFKQFDDGSYIIGYHDIWKSKGEKIKWRKISSFSEDFSVDKNTPIKDIAISDIDTNKILVAYLGPTWSEELNKTYLLISIGEKKNGEKKWRDLTQNLPAVVPRWLALSCVEIDKNDSQILYVGTEQLMQIDSLVYPYNGQMRIIKSTDNGTTWEDYSKNLPPFAVHKILSQKGIKGALYLATEVGIFYTNDEIYPENGWICFNENLPVCLVTDLEINYCENNLYCSTFGFGIWRTNLVDEMEICKQKTFIEINKETVFIGNKTFENNIKIIKNQTLKLENGTFSMPAMSKIILEKGSTLSLDNAVLTNLCKKNWYGVEKLPKKAKIILKKESKIENNFD